MKTILVTAVGAPPGLNVVRAIHESELYRIVVSDAQQNSIGLYQYNLPHCISPLANDKLYLKKIISFAKKHNVCGVIPCIEEDALIFSKEIQTLKSAGISVNLPGYEQVRIASNKGLMTQKCRENNIPHPESLVLSSGEDNLFKKVTEFLKRIDGPYIVKPTFGHGMKGVFTTYDAKETIEKIEAAECECILQEKIPGKVGSMYLSALLYDKKGEIIRRFASRSLLTLFEDGGPAVAGESIYCPELIERLEILTNSLGSWSGPINAEWILDPRDNEWKFIEVNPRHWGYGYLAVASGCDMPLANAAITCGDIPGEDGGYQLGVVFARNTFDYILKKHPFKLLES